MITIIISDDLSGAAGMASLIGVNIPVIPYLKLSMVRTLNPDIISVDLETRNLKDPFPRLNYVKSIYPEARILVRIDSLLRGSTLDFLRFIKQYGKIILTDTIPEFNRYTSSGSTVQKNISMNITEMLPDDLKPFITIADSFHYKDIQELAKRCIMENYIPVDPGILIKAYLEMK
jgi:hypothetical protein